MTSGTDDVVVNGTVVVVTGTVVVVCGTVVVVVACVVVVVCGTVVVVGTDWTVKQAAALRFSLPPLVFPPVSLA